MDDNESIRRKREEIENMGVLSKIPLITTYVIDNYITENIPSKIKKASNKIRKYAFAAVTVFSVVILPALYVYNRDKEEEKESPLSANKK